MHLHVHPDRSVGFIRALFLSLSVLATLAAPGSVSCSLSRSSRLRGARLAQGRGVACYRVDIKTRFTASEIAEREEQRFYCRSLSRFIAAVHFNREYPSLRSRIFARLEGIGSRR